MRGGRCLRGLQASVHALRFSAWKPPFGVKWPPSVRLTIPVRVQASTWVLTAILCAPDGLAEMTEAEIIGKVGGRVIGAAKACGVEDRRLWEIGEQVSASVHRAATSRRERSAATDRFISAYEAGFDEAKSGKIDCNDARAALRSLEARYEQSNSD